MSEPFAGITVVAIEQAVAAPFATRQLADLGARVIKVERPGSGDFARDYDRTTRGQSSYFVWLNRGKQSIALDLTDPADRSVLDALIARADVVVANLAPGAANRLGLGPTQLRRSRPSLITCTIDGYGPDGPYSHRKAYDLLVQCETGLLAATGTAHDAVKVGASVADIAAGMYAYSGIVTALYTRERTGVGSELRIAMLDALGEWLVQPAYYSGLGHRPWRRTGARHASIAPYGPYRVADGTVFLGVQNEREWATLCTAILGRPDLVADPRFATNPARVEHDAELTPLLEAAFAALPAEVVIDRLDRAGIASARVREPAELLDHPQLRARQRWGLADTPGGPVPALLPPVVVAGQAPRLRPVPALDEHGALIRAELARS